jgi:hypothetical protein
MTKEQFKALLMIMGGDFRITLFEDGFGYQLIVNGETLEEYCFKTRKEAYLSAKRLFKEKVSI